MGNSLQIGSVTPATVQFSQMTTTALTVDAGTTNYNVWRGTVNVGTRDTNLKAVTFKFVGSAPVDSFANLSLYIDGTKVAGPSMIDAANNNRLTFDLGSSSYLLRTGSHTVDVRGDVVKGSNRTATFSIENAADFMVEDSNLMGVYITPTSNGPVNGATIANGNSAYGTITVNKGSVTVDVDPAFTASEITGGATNMTIGQFLIKAYGEDVKVNTLQVTIGSTSLTPAPAGLANVGLYVNGGQVSSSQNLTATGTPLSFNLGSSLIVPAGQTVTVTVKADVRTTAGVNYTAGNLSASIGGVASNAQGQSSNEIISVAGTAVTDASLTISSGVGSFAKTAGFVNATVSPNTQNVKIGSWTVQAGSAEATIVNSATVTFSPTDAATLQNYSNLTLKEGSNTLGTPQGTAQSSNTFSFADITVPVSTTKTIELYANVGASTTATVQPSMAITYRGAVSNNSTTSGTVAGATVTSQTATLANTVRVSSSPVAQFVVGGTTQSIATFKISTSQSDAVVRKLKFTTTGTDAIESITVNGVTAGVIAGGTTTVSGLSIPVTTTGTDVTVTVKYSGFKNSTTGGALTAGVATVNVTLGEVEATSGNGTTITNMIPVSSLDMSLVASKPTVTVSAGNTNTLILGAENKVGEFTVSADANGKISVASTTVNLSTVGITSPFINAFRIADGNTTISTGSVATTTATTAVVNFNAPYEISAGQSKTFSLYAYVGGSASGSNTPYVASSLTGSGFKWHDVIGNNAQYLGTNIINFPTNSYTTQR
jgi:hypothetical protein